jgi:ketosteroid isomerase-like protein
MDTRQTANRLVELCRAKKYLQAIDELYAEDSSSREDHGGGEGDAKGKKAIRSGSEMWLGTFDLPEHHVDAPLFCGDKFAVRFTGRMVKKDGSSEHKYEEVGIYTVKDGKIVRQEFFYDMPM